MFLDAGNAVTIDDVVGGNGFHPARPDEVYDRWHDWLPTEILHHGSGCCEIARRWVLAMDTSARKGGSEYSGPRWLRQLYEWGPTIYPAFWCEAVRESSIDCGIHAAIAFEVFSARGVKCYRMQIVQEFSPDATRQWRGLWEKELAGTDWLSGSMIYHECVARQKGTDIAVWDPSSGCWIERGTANGYGSIRAYKLHSGGGAEALSWNGESVVSDQWAALK